MAIAVPDLDQSTAFYRDTLGAEVSGKDDLPEHGVTTVFVNLPNTKLELLHPLGEKSPIAGFLEKNKKGGIHHICIEVDNIREAMKSCGDAGIRLLNKVRLIHLFISQQREILLRKYSAKQALCNRFVISKTISGAKDWRSWKADCLLAPS